MLKTYLSILQELNWPGVYLIHPAHFEALEGDTIHGLYGNSSVALPIITVARGLRGRVLKNTIYHELGHKLFPSKRHWWIWLYGFIMARGGNDWQVMPLYGHTVADMPSRERLLHLSRLSAARFNRRRLQNAA